MRKIVALSLLLILLIPQTVMAEDLHQKVQINIIPKSGNYTKMFNIADVNNSWLDNMNIWENFRTDGRIVGEGIIPNPVQIKDYENDSCHAKMSIISVKYLDTYDIMSGTSESYIRLPLAINKTSFSENITMRIKLYAIEGDTYNITDFNYTDVKYTTYATNYLLYSYNANISSFVDLKIQNYSYPQNITNLSLTLFYLHIRAPIIAKSTYILLQYVDIPNAKENPFYVLSSYVNETGYYYSNSKIKSLESKPTWSMLCRYGMSEEVYSSNIPHNRWYYTTERENVFIGSGAKAYVSFAIPAYASKNSTMQVHFEFYDSTESFPIYTYSAYKHLKNGINTLFMQFNFSVSTSTTITKMLISFNSTNGNDIYLYLVRSPGQNIKYFSHPDDKIYFHASDILYYSFLSTTTYMVFQQFNFKGIAEPIIKYNTKYVYSLLDFPIAVYKMSALVLTNIMYYLTFGKVDLRFLYSNNFILKMVQGAVAFMEMVRNSPIGLFLRTVVDFVINSAAWWGNWLLQFGLFVLNIAAYALFLWPWIVLMRGLLALQEHGVDAMLDYFSSYVDRATSIMSKLLIRKGVG